MKTIEERAIAYRDDVRSGKHGTTVTDAYFQGATGQKAIDDAELAEVKRQRDEYYDELTKLRRQKVEIIDKACEWFKQLPPTWDIYEDSHYTIDRDSLIGDFRKAMEDNL